MARAALMAFAAFRKRVYEVTDVGRFLDNCFRTLPPRHQFFTKYFFIPAITRHCFLKVPTLGWRHCFSLIHIDSLIQNNIINHLFWYRNFDCFWSLQSNRITKHNFHADGRCGAFRLKSGAFMIEQTSRKVPPPLPPLGLSGHPVWISLKQSHMVQTFFSFPFVFVAAISYVIILVDGV